MKTAFILLLSALSCLNAKAQLERVERAGNWSEPHSMVVSSAEGELTAQVRTIQLRRVEGTENNTFSAQVVVIPGKRLYWIGFGQSDARNYSFLVLNGKLWAVRCDGYTGLVFLPSKEAPAASVDLPTIDRLLDEKLARFASEYLGDTPNSQISVDLDDYLRPSAFIREMDSRIFIIPSITVKAIQVSPSGFTIDLGHVDDKAEQDPPFDPKAVARVSFSNDLKVISAEVNGKRVYLK